MKTKHVSVILLICAALGLALLSGCDSPGGGSGGGHHHSSLKPTSKTG